MDSDVVLNMILYLYIREIAPDMKFGATEAGRQSGKIDISGPYDSRIGPTGPSSGTRRR
jgi:hypothetical protein